MLHNEIRLIRTGVFNLLSSRANLHLSYNPRAAVIADYKIIIGHVRLTGDVGEVPMA